MENPKRDWFTYLSYGFCIANTLTIIVLLDLLAFNFPYVSLFLCIVAVTVYLNMKLFKKRVKGK